MKIGIIPIQIKDITKEGTVSKGYQMFLWQNKSKICRSESGEKVENQFLCRETIRIDLILGL